MKNILISGVNGFLGSYLARELSKEYQVVGLKRSTSDICRLENIENLILCDIDKVGLEKIFKKYKPCLVFHAAVCYGRGNEKLSNIVQTNMLLSIEMIELSIAFNVGTFFNTDTMQQAYLSYYTTTKKHLRDYLVSLSQDIQIINCKLEHMYGYNDGKDKFVGYLVNSLQNKIPKISLTKGEQKRDFIYIKDVIQAYKILLKNVEHLPRFFEIDIGTGEQVSIKEFCLYLLCQFEKYQYDGNNTELDFGAIPYREGEPMSIDEDIKPLLALGFIPKYDYKKGIDDMLSKIYNNGILGGGGALSLINNQQEFHVLQKVA
ncbi:NAD-dependent epimerase/dehydratase family protein [Helicobacter canadensis]|nr:NAD(P)-dependent oxidoreductase [Helicobacter canadensis]